MTDVDVILQNSTIFRKIQFISLHPKERMEKEDWDELEETVGELIPYFSQILKNQLIVVAGRKEIIRINLSSDFHIVCNIFCCS